MQARIEQLKALHDVAAQRKLEADQAETIAAGIINDAKAQADKIIADAIDQADRFLAEAQARRKTFDDDIKAVAASLKAELAGIKVP